MDQHGAKAWLYHFEFPLENVLYPLLGNFHVSELGFVFNTWVNQLSSKSRQMSATFQRYWGNLVNTGDVNGGGGGGGRVESSASTTFWPHHNASTDFNIVLDIPASAQQHLYEEKCTFWDAHM